MQFTLFEIILLIIGGMLLSIAAGVFRDWIKTKFPKKYFLVGGVVLIIGAGLSIIMQNKRQKITDILPSTEEIVKPIFDSSDKRFKILVLPFDKECSYEGKDYDIGEVICRRLENLNSKDSLNLITHFFTQTINLKNIDSTFADSIMKLNHANQIIYGFYSLKECEANTSDKVCFKYRTNSTTFLPKEKNKKEDYDFININGMESLRNGTGQEDIDYVIYFIAGASAFKMDRCTKAVRLFKKIKNFEKDFPIAQSVAICYRDLEEYENSIRIFKKILIYDPNSFLSWSGLGGNYISLKNYSKAKEYIEKSITVNPNYDIAWANLGFVYSNLKNPLKAKECLEKAMNINPKNDKTIRTLAQLHADLQNFSDAKELFKKALEIDSLNDHLWLELGLANAELKNFQEAKECFLKTIKINPDNNLALTKLGMVNYYLKNYKEAEFYLNAALKKDSSFYQTWDYLGKLYLDSGNFKNAEMHFLKAVILNPKDVMALTNLGKCYLNFHNYVNSKKYSQKALKIDSENQSALYNLAVVYCLEKYKAMAFLYLKKAISKDINSKLLARKDPGFKWLWNDKEFIALTDLFSTPSASYK